MAEKTDKNPRGAGRPNTGVKRVSINISGQPEQIAKLKELAKRNQMNVSQFVFYAVDTLELAEGFRKQLLVKNNDIKMDYTVQPIIKYCDKCKKQFSEKDKIFLLGKKVYCESCYYYEKEQS